jgi:hypothetical protein
MEKESVFLFVLTILVTWRVTHLLSKEDGPFNIIFWVRKNAGAGFFGKLLDCFYCVSIWVALPPGICLGGNCWERIVYWLALSGAACLVERVTANLFDNKNSKTPNYFED